MRDLILTINSGSSSIKFAAFGMKDLDLRLRGKLQNIGTRPEIVVRTRSGEPLRTLALDTSAADNHESALAAVISLLERELEGSGVAAVGHRVVHGGLHYAAPVLIDAKVIADLSLLAPLAPLHQPHDIAAIHASCASMGDVPHVACFDTAFHRSHPRVADMYGLPESYYADGVRRYGFHGLSYEYIAGELERSDPRLAAGRVIVAHLGNGASLCAMRGGRSMDSTMGFTALDGLAMGTRSGSLDPGVVLYLQRERGMDAGSIERLLYRESGLLGISGISGDMRALLESPEPAARLAIDYFVYRIVKEVGGLAAVLGGLDGLVFTAGIGEKAAPIRAEVCDALRWLGLDIDAEANLRAARCISVNESRISACVIPTDEELTIARHTRSLIEAGS